MNTELDIALNKLRAEILANGSAELLAQFDFTRPRFYKPVSNIDTPFNATILGKGSAKMLEIYRTEVCPNLIIESTPILDMFVLGMIGAIVYTGYKIVTL